MTTGDRFRYRPRRSRQVAWLAAVTTVLVSVGAGLGPGEVGYVGAGFGTADRVALVGLGLLGAGGLLLFTRPCVEADDHGVRVRNILGTHEVPWRSVRAVRFDRGAVWAALELPDDELLGLVAVQLVDRERAVTAVRELRERLAAYRRADGGPVPAGGGSSPDGPVSPDGGPGATSPA